MSDTSARAALSRMNLRPVAVSQLHHTMLADLQQMTKVDIATEHNKFMDRRAELCSTYGLDSRTQDKPFAFANGIAVIPVTGTLLNRFGGGYGFATGYNFLRKQIREAMVDSDVVGIILDVNSGGGEAAGCFELSKEIKAASAVKPIMAYVDSNCYSAAYAIASAANKIVVTPSGGAGSIGVVAMHVNMGKVLQDFGLEITFIKFGAHKVDGNPYESLTDEVKADMQKSVDAIGERFVALVAENRAMNADTVRGTQARCYSADEALSLGLIDSIAAPIDAAKLMIGEIASGQIQMKGTETMDKETQTAAAPTQAAPVADTAADARTQERQRIAGITGCEEATGKSKLANHLALNTDLSVDQAKAILTASAAEVAPVAETKGGADFAAAMVATGNPNMDSGTGANGTTELSAAQQILQAQSAITGVKHNA